MRTRPVEDDQWSIVAWLWQCFRHDLAPAVAGLPYADGRYQTQGLPARHTTDQGTYLGWMPHPKTREPAPVGFAVVEGLAADRLPLCGWREDRREVPGVTGVPADHWIEST